MRVIEMQNDGNRVRQTFPMADSLFVGSSSQRDENEIMCRLLVERQTAVNRLIFTGRKKRTQLYRLFSTFAQTQRPNNNPFYVFCAKIEIEK